MSENDRIVFGGVDTHRDTHVAAVVDAAGRVLGSAPFRADVPGYERLNNWLGSLGPDGPGPTPTTPLSPVSAACRNSADPARPGGHRSRPGQTPTSGALPQSPRERLCRFSSR